MAFGLHFGGPDAAKKGEGGSESLKAVDGGSESVKREDGGSDSVKSRDGGSDSVKSRGGGSDSVKSRDEGADSVKSRDGGSDSVNVKRGDDSRCGSGGVGDEGSGTGVRKHANTEKLVKEEDTEGAEINSSSALSKEASAVVSEARKIQVKEAELEQAKVTAKDVHRQQEQAHGNFWSVSPLRWATITGNMYALETFRAMNAVQEEDGLEDTNFLELLNSFSEEGMNCLHLAANRGQCLELIHFLQHREILCKNRTRMNFKEEIRHSAELKSLQSLQRDVDYEDVLYFLVSIPGMDLNAVDKRGNTPLLLASSCGHLNAVQVLLQHSAAMDIFNEEGLNCLHTASLGGHSSVVDRIVQEAGLMDIKFLNVKSRAENEWSALHYAVANSRIHTLELLLNYPDIAVDTQDNEGCTPLILACSLGYVPAVRILLRKGANKLIKNNKTLNCSHVAAASGHVNVLKELAEHSKRPPEVPIAAASISENCSDHDNAVSERLWPPNCPESDVIVAIASSPSEIEGEEQYRRERTPYENSTSDQIFCSPADISTGSELSTVSVAVS